MRHTPLWVATAWAFALCAPAQSFAAAPSAADLLAFTIQTQLPPLTGRHFALVATELPDDASRQTLAADELIAGNHPAELFDWRSVTFTGDDANGVTHEVTLEVSPDYLSVGTATDFLYAPLGLPEAVRVARALDFWLPTPLVVDKIYEAADHRFQPHPLPPSLEMRMPYYWLNARRTIQGLMEQPRDALLAGHKKDVVLTARLRYQPSQLAIYGWHRDVGEPIQGLSLFHGKTYADYSHGIRAVAPIVTIDGEAHAYVDVLKDPILSALLSDEGPIDVERMFHNAAR